MSTTLTNCSSPFAGRDYAVVAAISAVSGFISLLGSCFIVSIIVLFEKWRFFPQRLVLFLAIAVGLESFAVIIHRVDYNNERSAFYDGFCKFSGYIEQCTSWMELMAIVSVTVYIFLLAMFSKRTERLQLGYIFFIFGFPLLFNWIPFTLNAFGRAGAWCWIMNEDIYTCEEFIPGLLLQFILYYIPLYVILIVLICLYLAILVKLNCYDKRKWTGSSTRDSHENEIVQSKISEEIRWLLWYPFIYFVFNIFPLINRIQGLVPSANPVLALWVLSGFIYPLKGAVIALAFALDPGTRKRLKCVFIMSAIKNLSRKSGRDVKEYPAQHLSAATEEISIKDRTYKVAYWSMSNNGIEEDTAL